MGTPNNQSKIPRPIIFPSDASVMPDTVYFRGAPVAWREPTHCVGVELLERCTTAQEECRVRNFDRLSLLHAATVACGSEPPGSPGLATWDCPYIA